MSGRFLAPTDARNGELRQVLQPGAYRFWPGDKIEIYDQRKTQFTRPLLEVLLKNPDLQPMLETVDLKDDERALIYRDGRLADILGQEQYAFWKAPKELKVETYNVKEFSFQHDNLESILTQAEANLIRRREETAAARSQANTAKLLADNAVLQRMKELKLLQEILAGAKATFVLGQGDLREQVGKIVGQDS